MSTLRAPPTAAAQPEPTLEQLGIAYRHLRNHLWPDTVQAALAHPVFGVCLRQAARSVNRACVCVPHRVAVGQLGAYVPPTPTQPRVSPASTARAMHITVYPLAKPKPKAQPKAMGNRFDFKRAAANDRDDQEASPA